MALLTTTAGWFPKPPALERARRRFAEGDLSDTELRTVEDAATRDALDLQRELGLDLLVDGQMERSDMVTYFADRLAGFEPGGLVRCFGNRYYRRPRIVAPIARTAVLTVERWQAARAHAPRPLKAVLTGPYTLMHWSFVEHATREECCAMLAEALRLEVRDLVQAGATEIQLDEPAIGSRPDELALAHAALARVLEPAVGHARTWLQLAYADLAPCAEAVFALPVDGFLVELANSRYERLAILDALPAGRALAAGVVDVLSADVEGVDAIRRAVDRLLASVPAERLWLAPDGGLRALSPEVAEAKLRALRAAATSY